MRAVLLVAFVLASGCSTVQTPATKDIDGIIEGGILDTDKPLTREEKAFTKATLVRAEKEIVSYKGEAEKNARLAKQARVFWIITFSLAILAVAVIFLAVRSAVIRAVFARSRDSP